MENVKAPISGIIKHSVIDGPGNRIAIFFQGCQFNCLYCHNPHTIGLCRLCGECVKTCPTQSLQLDKINQRIAHNTNTCQKCDKCIKGCPHSSSPFYRQYTVAELLNEILEIRDFISGVTVSGGEVMLHSRFLKQLFENIRQHPALKDLSIFIDSNGRFSQSHWEPILPLVDGFMIDLKAVLPKSHHRLTGKDNQKVLETIQFLDKQGKLYEVRTVIVPGYNDSNEEIKALGNFYNSLSSNVNKVLIRMRKHGIREKYSFLQEPTGQHILQIKEQIGLKNIKTL